MFDHQFSFYTPFLIVNNLLERHKRRVAHNRVEM